MMDPEMDNELRQQTDPLGSLNVNVIEAQNLVTTYVLLCHNLLYGCTDTILRTLTTPSGESFSGGFMIPRCKERWARSDGPETANGHVGAFILTARGPTDWSCTLFDDYITVRLIMFCSNEKVEAKYYLKSESMPVNEDLIDLQQGEVEEARDRLHQIHGTISPIHADNADVLGDGEGSDGSESLSLPELPQTEYCVITETTNNFTRSITKRNIEANSILRFAIELTSAEEDDLTCEIYIAVTTLAFYHAGHLVVTSITKIEEVCTQEGEEVKKFTTASPQVIMTQPMDRTFAELIMDGAANNYTAVVQIIGLALILHFGSI